ncbi:MAG TPA: hypothetical protein VH951_05740 [Dehalococcoidia bacterium]
MRTLTATLEAAQKAVNRARVVGDAVFDEAFDFQGAEQGGELVRNVADLGITSTPEATARAGYELRRAQLEAGGSRLVVPMNVGQELYDVVTVTDDVAGVDAEDRRVQALRFRYHATKSVFDLILELGAV